MNKPEDWDNISAAVLGFYGAIRICQKYGYDWRMVADATAPVALRSLEVEREQKETQATPPGKAPKADAGR